MAILALLDGERTVNDICDIVGLAQPAISHHLALLRHGRLIEAVRDGKTNRYSRLELGDLALKACEMVSEKL